MGNKSYFYTWGEDLIKLDLDQLIVSLITHEMINSNKYKKTKKYLALKAYPNADDEDFSEEDWSLISKKFKTFFIRKRECHQHPIKR